MAGSLTPDGRGTHGPRIGVAMFCWPMACVRLSSRRSLSPTIKIAPWVLGLMSSNCIPSGCTEGYGSTGITTSSGWKGGGDGRSSLWASPSPFPFWVYRSIFPRGPLFLALLAARSSFHLRMTLSTEGRDAPSSLAPDQRFGAMRTSAGGKRAVAGSSTRERC